MGMFSWCLGKYRIQNLSSNIEILVWLNPQTPSGYALHDLELVRLYKYFG